MDERTGTPDPPLNLQIGVGLPTLGERGKPGTLDAAGAARYVEALTTSPAEAADRFAAYAGAGATSISISPGIGSVGQEWRRQCELVAEARAMLS